MLTAMTRTAIAFAAIALTGCGSTSKPQAPAPATATTTTTPSPAKRTPAAMTHAEFVHALNSSCSVEKPEQKRLERKFESAMERNALPEAAGIYETMIKMTKAHTARITNLTPSAEDQAAFSRYLAAQKRIQGIGGRLIKAMQEDDIDHVARLTPLFTREANRRLTAAIDLGADKCGG